MFKTEIIFAILIVIAWSKPLLTSEARPALDTGPQVAIPSLNSSDCEASLKELSEVTDKNIPAGCKVDNLGVLFEGTIIQQLPSDKFGQLVWLVRPEHVFGGANQIQGKFVKIVSPSASAGGAEMKIGRRYRILAWDFRLFLLGKRSGRFGTNKGGVLSLPLSKQVQK